MSIKSFKSKGELEHYIQNRQLHTYGYPSITQQDLNYFPTLSHAEWQSVFKVDDNLSFSGSCPNVGGVSGSPVIIAISQDGTKEILAVYYGGKDGKYMESYALALRSHQNRFYDDLKRLGLQ